jgi:hypothetical protein
MEWVCSANEGRNGAAIAAEGRDRDQPPTQRALVPVMPARPVDAVLVPPVRISANAAFLTHLIATAEGASQTRKHRRADPDRVIATYEAMVQVPTASGPCREYRR